MIENMLADKKACAECGSQAHKKQKKCSVCGSAEFVDYDCNIRLTPEQVAEQFPDLPKRGLWTEVIDFSEKDYSSNFGFYGFLNGEHIWSSGGGHRRIGQAIEASKEWKRRMKEDYAKRMDAKIKRNFKRQTWGTGSMRQDT